MSLRSKLDLSSDFPYTEWILRDVSKLFSAANHIVVESKRIVFYFPDSVPHCPSLHFVAGKALSPLSDEFIEVDYAYIYKDELLRVLIDGLVDCNPALRLTIQDYVKKKK